MLEISTYNDINVTSRNYTGPTVALNSVQMLQYQMKWNIIGELSCRCWTGFRFRLILFLLLVG